MVALAHPRDRRDGLAPRILIQRSPQYLIFFLHYSHVKQWSMVRKLRATSEAIGSKAEESDSCIIIGLPVFACLAHGRYITHDSIPRWCDAYLSIC